MGMGISSTFERPRERRVLLVAARWHALKAAAAGQAWKYPVSHAAGTVLACPEFHSAKFDMAFSSPASRLARAGDMADKS
jgi:hypothetical protein